MKIRLTRKALIALLAVAAVGGAGVAVAASSGSGSSPREKYLDDVAHRLGVTPSALQSAMQGAEIDRIEEAVASGRLSKQQGEQFKQRLKEGRGPFFRGSFGGGPLIGGLAQTAFGYLGLSRATLRADLVAGKSLAQIADSTPGKSSKGLKEALESSLKSRVAMAASKGRISKAQQEKLLSKLSAHIERLLNRKGGGLPGLGFGFGFHVHRGLKHGGPLVPAPGNPRLGPGAIPGGPPGGPAVPAPPGY